MTISYSFDTTQIHLFEFNLLPDLLLAPAKTIQNTNFRFLANENGYIAQQNSDATINTPHFVFERFPRRIMRNSSLWKRYRDTHWDENKYSWDLQVPFQLRLRKHDLEILAIPEKDRAAVKADSYLLLNSLGWSTHINIVVDISLKPSHVADLCANLRDKAYGPPAYRLNGVDMTLKEIFLYYRKVLMTDILSPGAKYVRPDHIPHLIFVDVISASGSNPVPFYQFPSAFIQVLARIIKRNNVRIKMEYQNGGTYPMIDHMLTTQIDPEFFNFSLTDFDQGSFTFMQREALDDERSSRPFCYARNTRDAFLVSYLWLESYRRMNERAKSKTKIRNLLECGNWALSELRNNYSSRTSLRLLQKHKGLVDFLALSDLDEDDE